ncbi:hypothetical protein NPIL_535141 [Nephila pilipes]|uniref:Uncharacterized protein n=1 Tax=Nephila pilipes TaxID=299642 RepID=A0A8X6Q070_NEPPI|nr:hypothetical protein NPIL_535141 [Nephila pilipes]
MDTKRHPCPYRGSYRATLRILHSHTNLKNSLQIRQTERRISITMRIYEKIVTPGSTELSDTPSLAAVASPAILLLCPPESCHRLLCDRLCLPSIESS